MNYSSDGGSVLLDMTREEYEKLTYYLGFAASSAHTKSDPLWREIIQFINDLNRANPDFLPLRPEQFVTQ
jgi:hypothetical protein